MTWSGDGGSKYVHVSRPTKLKNKIFYIRRYVYTIFSNPMWDVSFDSILMKLGKRVDIIEE